MSDFKVYMHTFPNGKRYIGITQQSISKRWQNGIGYKSQVVYNAIQKYGWDNIKHEILFENLTQEEAEHKERELIAQYQTTNSKHGYNIALGGDHIGKHSEATKEKLRQLHLGKKLSHEHIEKVRKALSGRKLPQHVIDNLVRINKGRIKSQEEREKLRQWHLGRKLSEETKEKIRRAHIGQKRTKEQIKAFKDAVNKPENLEKRYQVLRAKLNKKVAYINDDGEIIQVFSSIKECAQILHIKRPSQICAVCKGKRKHTLGLKFKYIEESSSNEP